MPKSYSVAEIKDLDPDEIVHKFTGTVTGIWEPNETRTGMTFQNLMVEDRDGDKIKVTLKDREELEIDDWKGEEITILAHQGKKEWSGVYANDHKYEGKTTRIVLVTEAAEVVSGGSAKNGRDDDREGRRSRNRRDDDDRERQDDDDDRTERRSRKRDDDDDDRSERKGERKRERDDDDLDRAKEKIVKIGNLMHLCSGMGVDLGRAFESTFGMHFNEVFKDGLGAHIHSVFIQATRDGLHNLMPIEPLYEVPEPEKEKEGKKSTKEK